MEFSGNLINVSKNWNSNQFEVTFSVDENGVINEIAKLKDKKLSIKAVQHREKRSLDANGLLWLCLGRIANVLRTDKWEVYLSMLKRYGKYTYICVKPNVVDAVKMQWRETEVVGEVDINGQKAVQMLCYFGSSTYNTKEFSILLDGVISEMVEMGIQAPTSAEMREAITRWEKQLSQ